MIDFIYELPGGLSVYVECEVAPESVTILRCGSMTGDLDPERVWIETDAGVMPLTLLIEQEAEERSHGR